MSKDAFEAVRNQQALKRLRTAVGTTTATPLYPQEAPADVGDFEVEELPHSRAEAQARAAYLVHGPVRPAKKEWPMLTGRIIMTAPLGDAMPTQAQGRRVTLIGAASMGTQAWNLLTTCRVHQYAERVRLNALGAPEVLYVDDHFTIEPGGAFSYEESDFTHSRREVATAFNRVEPVEVYRARAQQLLAELQNGAASGASSARRLRELQEVAAEEGLPFSLPALEALVAFASAHPDMPPPDLTLSATGGILAEWRREGATLALYFVTPVHVQYLIKRPNPLHPSFSERSSGSTTVDRVGDAIKRLVPDSKWPIRA